MRSTQLRQVTNMRRADVVGLGSRSQHRGDETAGVVEDHNRLKAVFTVMGIQQP